MPNKEITLTVSVVLTEEDIKLICLDLVDDNEKEADILVNLLETNQEARDSFIEEFNEGQPFSVNINESLIEDPKEWFSGWDHLFRGE